MEIDRDGNGVSLQDVDLSEKVRTAQSRAQIASQKLKYDLDGDRELPGRESNQSWVMQMGRGMRRQSDAAIAANIKREVAMRADKIMKADADGNGQLSGVEVSKPDPERNRDYGGVAQQTTLARAMLKADPNGDGVLTEAETFTILGEVFGGMENAAPTP